MVHPSMLTILLLPAVAMAAVSMEEVTEHEDHPGKCFVNATGTAHDVDDLWYSNTSCKRMSCTKFVAPSGENKFLVITSTCPSVSAEAPCYLVEDKGRNYPECCPRYECPPLEAMSHFNEINVLDNEISTDNHHHADHLHMMESQHAPAVVVAAPESVMEDSIANYDVTLESAESNEAEVSDFASPFRSQFFRYGKPILGGRPNYRLHRR